MNYLYLGLMQATFLTASAIACAAIAGKCQAKWLLASVLGPIVAHNLANTLGFLTAALP